MAISHRSRDSLLPLKDQSDDSVSVLKLGDAPPRFRRKDSSDTTGGGGGGGGGGGCKGNTADGDISNKKTAERISVAVNDVGHPVRTSTPDYEQDVFLCESSDPQGEEALRGEHSGEGVRCDMAEGVGDKAPVPFTTPLRKSKRGVNVSAFKVGMSLSLRTSPRRNKWEKSCSLSATLRVRVMSDLRTTSVLLLTAYF